MYNDFTVLVRVLVQLIECHTAKEQQKATLAAESSRRGGERKQHRVDNRAHDGAVS